jgi:hypothetical protein
LEPPAGGDRALLAADPRISGEPLVIGLTDRALRSAEKNRRAVERGLFDLHSRGNVAPGVRASDHQDAHRVLFA